MGAIYQPKGRANEYSKWACNFYTGCDNACDYCYSRTGFLASIWTPEAKLKKGFKDCIHAMEIFEKQLNRNLDDIKKNGLFFSFTTDPLISNTAHLTLEAIQLCQELKVPVVLLTKCVDYLYMLTIHDDWDHSLISVGVTLTGHDELEGKASPNAERITAMKQLHKLGFKTWASIEPIIDLNSSLEMIRLTADFCDEYKIGILKGASYDFDQLTDFYNQVYQLVGLENNDNSHILFKKSFLDLIR